jgi:YVTN family beta-propeller protein
MAGSAQGAPFGSPVTTTDLQIAAVPGTVPAVIATIPVGEGPSSVAISSDDTVYVTNYDSDSVSVINPGSMSEDHTITVFDQPVSLTISPDDTVYVTNSGSDSISVIAPGSLTQGPAISLSADDTPVGLALSPSDDTLYVAASGSDRLISIDLSAPYPLNYTMVGNEPVGVAVTSDDTVYVTNKADGTIMGIHNLVVDDTTTVGTLPLGITSWTDGSVYVANAGSGTLSRLTGNPPVVDDSLFIGVFPVSSALSGSLTPPRLYAAVSGDDVVAVMDADLSSPPEFLISVGNAPGSIAVSEATGLVYVTNANYGSRGTVSVIEDVSPFLVDDSGVVGEPITIDIEGANYPHDPLKDDSTIQLISFDGVPVTDWERDLGVNSWSGPVPPGSGTVDVTVLFNGGQVASAGTFTYPALPPPPTPTPVNPPSAPMSVIGTPGDHSAALNWTAPTSPGSFPVTTYEVNSSPAASSCITSTLSCTVTGLTNYTAYTFSVRALNGAGWSPWSTPSEVVTPTAAPTPTLVIAGTRQDVRSKPGIRIIGTSTHLAAGTILRPWIRFPGQASFTQGTAQILVDTNGDFTWGRTTGKKTYVYLATPDDNLRSNRVTIPAA